MLAVVTPLNQVIVAKDAFAALMWVDVTRGLGLSNGRLHRDGATFDRVVFNAVSRKATYPTTHK